jgi:hypothetical protein
MQPAVGQCLVLNSVYETACFNICNCKLKNTSLTMGIFCCHHCLLHQDTIYTSLMTSLTLARTKLSYFSSTIFICRNRKSAQPRNTGVFVIKSHSRENDICQLLAIWLQARKDLQFNHVRRRSLLQIIKWLDTPLFLYIHSYNLSLNTPCHYTRNNLIIRLTWKYYITANESFHAQYNLKLHAYVIN